MRKFSIHDIKFILNLKTMSLKCLCSIRGYFLLTYSETPYSSSTSTENNRKGLSPVKLVAMKIISQVKPRNAVKL
jgi:hypothetical protein